MRSTMLLPFVLAVSLGLCSAQGDTCAPYTQRLIGPFAYGASDTTDHLYPGPTSHHAYAQVTTGSCVYSQGPGPCFAVAEASSSSAVDDNGSLSKQGVDHVPASADKDGSATATSPANAVAVAEGDGGVAECLLGVCPFGVSISVAGLGATFSGHSPLWHAGHVYSNTCVAKTGKTCTNCCSTAIGGGGDISVCGPSPILIDTKKQGWHLTNPNTEGGYVTFRFGKELRKVSWPDWRYDNAWLVYDSRGVVDGADDLFGNYTPHANADYMGIKNHPSPNGWLALAFYDWPARGGVTDGVIDKKDAIWAKLKLWYPRHCHEHPDQPCVALDSELVPLDRAGIHSLSLVYQGTMEVDKASGSQCSFTALVNPDEGERQKSKDGRLACDFNLAVRK